MSVFEITEYIIQQTYHTYIVKMENELVASFKRKFYQRYVNCI